MMVYDKGEMMMAEEALVLGLIDVITDVQRTCPAQQLLAGQIFYVTTRDRISLDIHSGSI